MPQTDLAELRRLWEAATKGEWVAPDSGDDCLYASAEMMGQRRPIAHFVRLPNRKFIVAAHNALPALLDELEAAREEIAELKQGIASANSASQSYYEKILWYQSQVPERDRRMKAIGAAEELERLNAEFEAIGFSGLRGFTERAAKLRQEAEGK